MSRHTVSRIFRSRTSIWQVDVDAFGDLRSSALLRFLQETATRASTDAGFDTRHYEHSGTTWIVRRTNLTILAAMHHGQEIETKTWISAFRRVRCHRHYEVTSDGRLVASASSDWVHADRINNRPRTIPEEMQRAFLPEGAPPFVPPPPRHMTPSPTACRLERRVEFHELDSLGHVNNSTYLHYLEQGALDAAAAAGWSLQRQLDAGGRFRSVAHDLEYVDAARYDDVLSIITWPVAVSADRIERQTLVVRPGSRRPLLHAASTYEWVDAHTGAPQAMPATLRSALDPAGLR